MGDEVDTKRLITDEVYKDIVSILKTVYGGGYVNQKLNWQQLKDLRGKSYRTLKALGLEK